MLYIQTKERILFGPRNEGNPVIGSTTWINLQNLMLSEIRQTQMDECYMIPLM